MQRSLRFDARLHGGSTWVRASSDASHSTSTKARWSQYEFVEPTCLSSAMRGSFPRIASFASRADTSAICRENARTASTRTGHVGGRLRDFLPARSRRALRRGARCRRGAGPSWIAHASQYASARHPWPTKLIAVSLRWQRHFPQKASERVATSPSTDRLLTWQSSALPIAGVIVAGGGQRQECGGDRARRCRPR